MNNKGNNLTNEELYNLFRNIPKTDRMPSRAKQITDIFNSLDINRRKSYLDYLRSLPNAEQKFRIFTNTIRKQAVIDFWFHEREAIINGTSTYDWSPRQIENIMNLDPLTGKMNPTYAGEAPQVDDKDNIIKDKKSNTSYYGHHMVSVNDAPEYAGDWKNIQALNYSEHYDGAHLNHKTKIPTKWYYNPDNKQYYEINVSKDPDFKKLYEMRVRQSIFKSDDEIRRLYKIENNMIKDSDILALKNIELAIKNLDFDRFSKGIELAENYGTANLFEKIGMITDSNLLMKYNIKENISSKDTILTLRMLEIVVSRTDVAKLFLDSNSKKAEKFKELLKITMPNRYINKKDSIKKDYFKNRN